MKNTEFSNELYLVIYGANANVTELKKQKSIAEVWNDIVIFLAKDDITKIDEIKKMSFIKAMEFLDSKVKTLKANTAQKEKVKIEPVGFKTNIENKK